MAGLRSIKLENTTACFDERAKSPCRRDGAGNAAINPWDMLGFRKREESAKVSQQKNLLIIIGGTQTCSPRSAAAHNNPEKTEQLTHMQTA
jgi:hypothetical protein